MRKWLPFLIPAIAITVTAFFYQELPERMPTHWNARGEVDGWGSRAIGAWMMPCLMLAFAILFYFVPRIDPRGKNFARFAGTYDTIVIATLLFTLVLHTGLMLAATGRPIPIERILPGSVGLLLIVIGNLLPRVRSNWFLGVRTPWTLSSEKSWEKTHRLAGYLMVALGLSLIASALVWETGSWRLVSLGVPIVVVALVAYSYIVWRDDPDRHGLTSRTNG